MDNQDTHSKLPVWSPSPLIAIIVAAIAGLIAIGIVQSIDPVFPRGEQPKLGNNPSPDQWIENINYHRAYYARNYAVIFGIVGGCLGLLFVGVTIRKLKVPSALLAGILGAVGGAVGGYFAGMQTGVDIGYTNSQSMYMAVQFGFLAWGLMALGIAIGATILQRDLALLGKSVVTALAASILSVMAILLVFSVAFNDFNFGKYVPEAARNAAEGDMYLTVIERVVWVLVGTGTFAAIMSLGLKPSGATETVADADKVLDTETSDAPQADENADANG